MNITWKNVVGYEGLYKINNIGIVKSMPKTWICGNRNSVRYKDETIMKQNKDSNGYFTLWLSKNNKAKQYSVHKLVALAFLPNIENKKCVNHKNSDRCDNRVENLEWCTHSENTIHAVKNGRQFIGTGETHGMCVLSEKEVLKIRSLASTHTHLEISKMFPVGRRTIGNIINRKNWTHI